ncbi:hypothetical protein BDV19DRAFT_400566 [Aspergillus venezuelensis]
MPASLDSLSLELVEFIKFQVTVERLLYQISDTFTDSAQKFQLKTIGGKSWRWRAVQALYFGVSLPAYDERRGLCLEKYRKHKANLAVFEKGDKAEGSLEVVFYAMSSTDQLLDPEENRWLHREYSLEIDPGKVSLPKLECVGAFSIGGRGRRIHPATMRHMISTCPSLRDLNLRLPPGHARNWSLRAMYKRDLAKALEDPALNGLEALTLDMEELTPKTMTFRWYYTGDRELEEPEELEQDELDEIDRLAESERGSSDTDSEPAGSENDDWIRRNSTNIERASFRNGQSPIYTWRKWVDPNMFDNLARSFVEATFRMPRLEHLDFQANGPPPEPWQSQLRDNRAIGFRLFSPEWMPGVPVIRVGYLKEKHKLIWRWVLNSGDSLWWHVPPALLRTMKERVGEDGEV